MRSHTPLILAVACLGCFAACREAKVKHYRVAHEEAPAQTAPGATSGIPAGGDMAGTAVPTAEGPGLTWTAPADWREKAGSAMRKGSYAVPGPGGDADLGVTAFPGEVGGDLANVNRWRAQLRLPPIGADELAAAVTRFSANGLDFAVVDLAPNEDEHATRLIGAIVPLNGATWFFKLTGPGATVAAQREAFLNFLHTVKAGSFGATTPAATAPVAATPGGDMVGPAVPTAEGAALAWTAPADWKGKTGSTMRKGSYAVPGPGGDADLGVTAFPGEVGGDLANVNRWRAQLQLPPIGADELAAAVTRFSANGLDFAVVDLATKGAPDSPRLIGAIVPHDGATWFFKLTGPDATVAAQRDAFLAFLHTVKIR